jgi:hypothetical protein
MPLCEGKALILQGFLRTFFLLIISLCTLIFSSMSSCFSRGKDPCRCPSSYPLIVGKYKATGNPHTLGWHSLFFDQMGVPIKWYLLHRGASLMGIDCYTNLLLKKYIWWQFNSMTFGNIIVVGPSNTAEDVIESLLEQEVWRTAFESGSSNR